MALLRLFLHINWENKERVRLIKALNPLQAIHPQELRKNILSVLPNLTPIRKLPFPWVYQSDKVHSNAYTDMKITSFQEVNQNLVKWLDKSYTFSSYTDHIVYYKIEANDLSVPKVSELKISFMFKFSKAVFLFLFHNASR